MDCIKGFVEVFGVQFKSIKINGAVDMILEMMVSWLPNLILVVLIWSLMLSLYTDLSQPFRTARIFSTTGYAGELPGNAFSNDAARFHEFALLSAAAYGESNYEELQKVKTVPELHGLWSLALEKHTEELLLKATSTGVKGLDYQLYKRRDSNFQGKTVYAIVFRGTDRFTDFKSNLRWFLKALPGGDDQYDFVRKNISTIVSEIYKNTQLDNSEIEIIAAGHSLGGGLAQQAAYSCDVIRTVYTYMSTSVTGFFDVEKEARKRRAVGLRIFRIHETGEILAALRRLMKLIFPVSQINPTIVEVRYNFQNYRFNPFKLHSIALLAENLTGVWAGQK